MHDRLTTLFDTQFNLQKKLGYNFAIMTDEERTAYIKEYEQHAEHELHEMLAELPFFKSWKKYPDIKEARDYAYRKAKEEFIDSLHFFLNIAIALGFSPGELVEMYLTKNGINYERQEDVDNYKPCKTAEEIRQEILDM